MPRPSLLPTLRRVAGALMRAMLVVIGLAATGGGDFPIFFR